MIVNEVLEGSADLNCSKYFFYLNYDFLVLFTSGNFVTYSEDLFALYVVI
jgi:hypothetical protein